MIEDDLRAAFVRHEPLTPSTGPLRVAIDRLAAVRRRRRQRFQAAGVTLALLAALGVGVPQLRPIRRSLARCCPIDRLARSPGR